MTTTSPPTATRPLADAALPWPALLVLGGATLVMVTGEMLPTAVLAPMSAGLGVSDSAAGLLVSIWAAIPCTWDAPTMGERPTTGAAVERTASRRPGTPRMVPT